MTNEILLENGYFDRPEEGQMNEREMQDFARWLEAQDMEREVSVFLGFQRIMNNAKLCLKK